MLLKQSVQRKLSILRFYTAFVTHIRLFGIIHFTQDLFSNADIIDEDGSSYQKNAKPLIKRCKNPNAFKLKFDF